MIQIIELVDRVLAQPSAPQVARVLSLTDGTVCAACGTIMQRTGTCYTCPECGASAGC